jgi:L-asparaginase II
LSRDRIVVERGGRVESEHRFAWRLADGDHDEQAFLRSAAKPLQALPAVRAGALERLGLDDRHLAIGCASHGGSPEHVARVSEILAACGLGVGHLSCGAVAPRDPVEGVGISVPPR